MKRDTVRRSVRAGLVCWRSPRARRSPSSPIRPPNPPGTGAKCSTRTKPAKAATVSPEAQTELDAITVAYGKLTSLELAGTVDVKTDVGGESHSESAPFTSSYSSPTMFRHATKDDLVIGCTGEKSFLFAPEKKLYLQADAPKTKSDFAKSPSPAFKALEQQNPSLFLAMAENAGKTLINSATDVSKLATRRSATKPLRRACGEEQ